MRGYLARKLPTVGPPLLVFLLLLALWQLSTAVFSIPSYLLPSPVDVAMVTGKVADTFPHDFGVTFVEAVGGFLLGSIGAFLFGLVFAHSTLVEKSLMPYVIAMKTMPIVAVAPLLVIWLGVGILPKVILSALISFFPVLIGTVKGLKEVDPDQIDLFRSLAATKWQILKWLRLPSSLTYLFPALRVSVVLSVIGAIVAEFASANAGIGFKIMLASFHVDTPAMFLYIIASALMSLVLYGTIALAERFMLPWSFSARSKGDMI